MAGRYKDGVENIPLEQVADALFPEVVLTTVDEFLNWGRSWSVWYLLFATACCGIELMQFGGPRTDADRIGSVFRATPRQSDLMIVAGTITYKMASRVKLLYEQMAEPKYVLSMGSCANCGGPFWYSYSVLRGIDKVIPVDFYVAGCPPRPEALLQGVIEVQKKIKKERYLRSKKKGVRG